MFAFKSTSFLCLVLFASSILAKQTTTNVFITTDKETKSVKATLNDCTDVDQDGVTMMSIKRKCHVFLAPGCMGRVVHLEPGEHESFEPVDIGSVYCEA